jgi:uncharacterized protein YciI
MARYVVIFRDNPDAGWIRDQHHQEHFDYLRENCGHIPIGGGLREDHDQPWFGGLWVVEVKRKADVAALVEGDPYFKLGLRSDYQVFGWGKAPNYGAVTL